MHYWRAALTHASFLIAQPAYLAARYIFDYGWTSSRSPLKLTIHAVIWLLIATRISIPFFTSPLRRLPSPPGERWILCHLNFNGGKPITTLFEDMLNNTPNDGLLVLWGPLYLFSEIVITRPDALMDLLNTHSYDWEKPTLIRIMAARVLGEGLLSVEGATHKAMKRVVAPAFSGGQIRGLAPLFYAKGVALADIMARRVKETDGGALEMMELSSHVTLDIIGAAGVGMEFNTLENEDSTLAKAYGIAMNPPAFFLTVDTLIPRWITRRLRWKAWSRTVEAQNHMRNEVRALLVEKKREMKHDDAAHHSKDIIASIMKSGDFSDDYLVGQLLTFLAAGHDTTAAALVWAAWLLSLHPRHADRLRAECETQLSDVSASSIDASMFDAENMPFLNAVCSEVLRLYPPVPSTARHAVVATTIGEVRIPRGTAAHISPWAINRNRGLWGADAAEFNPARWLEGPNVSNGGAETPYALLTFLHGPHSCIGQSFARLEMKCVLAVLFTRFRFEVAEPERKVEIGGFVTIKPEGGLKFKVHHLRKEVIV